MARIVTFTAVVVALIWVTPAESSVHSRAPVAPAAAAR
jgi:hypothetical protein